MRALTHFHTFAPDYWRSPPFLLGCAVFIAGMHWNLEADDILRRLRGPGEKGYKIPFGGLFEYVSTANYTAEIMEWFGFALACQSYCALAFALFCLLYLGGRARQNHEWLRNTFADKYPAKRKIIIPFIY
jgi:3-oxo-5-alpha-steroid 4-dehydrogenase 1